MSSLISSHEVKLKDYVIDVFEWRHAYGGRNIKYHNKTYKSKKQQWC